MRDAARGTRHEGKASRPAPGLRPPALVRSLGLQDYETVWQQMRQFTAARNAETADEFWFVEHPPVYTLGVAARREHLPRMANGIPVVKSDRGGQITYHGPGQVVAYTLLDLRRIGLGVRALVRKLERAVIELAADYRIDARGREDAPGVYVDNAKIAALGLRIRDGRCYHGLSLNVDMDLSPFAAIDPCGYPGLEVTQLRNLGITDSPEAVAGRLAQKLAAVL
ncbi:MAG TPA: lipoyl(octanoyl) transferase LipB [Burkholderiales bacterium]|nr:lipoyl(octanoyl) transferase LipB [Burkholderiales bacterium]